MIKILKFPYNSASFCDFFLPHCLSYHSHYYIHYYTSSSRSISLSLPSIPLSHMVVVAVLLSTVALFAVSARAQQVPQCLCKDVDPCARMFMDSWQPCLDQCQHAVKKTGGDYQELKKCINSKQGMLQAAISCSQTQHSTACAKQTPAPMVPKRYPENLEIAAMAEINRMINNMGLASEAKGLMDAGKAIFGCVRKCMAKQSNHCDKKLKCGLDLPPDNVVVQNVKKCAIGSGLNTANAQQLCECASKAGVKGLSSATCSKIVIS